MVEKRRHLHAGLSRAPGRGVGIPQLASCPSRFGQLFGDFGFSMRGSGRGWGRGRGYGDAYGYYYPYYGGYYRPYGYGAPYYGGPWGAPALQQSESESE